jgi:hypothetical protein
LEFAGGVEGRRQRRVLGYLQIAEMLGDTAEGRGAREVARKEAAELIEIRGTTLRVASAIVGVLLTAGVAVFLVVFGTILLAAARSARDYLLVATTYALTATYAAWCLSCCRSLGRARRIRQSQRPSSLIVDPRASARYR